MMRLLELELVLPFLLPSNEKRSDVTHSDVVNHHLVDTKRNISYSQLEKGRRGSRGRAKDELTLSSPTGPREDLTMLAMV